MSQPAVSTQLARLRGIAGDPLFVRNAQGMQPTPLAREWATPVAGALAALEQALNPPSGFDPAASRRSFIVYMTDVGQTLILNRLVSRIAAAAPGVRLRMVTAWEGALAERLDDGALDLAVGWIPQLKARKTSTLLFKDRYVGVRARPAGGRPGSLRWPTCRARPTRSSPSASGCGLWSRSWPPPTSSCCPSCWQAPR